MNIHISEIFFYFHVYRNECMYVTYPLWQQDITSSSLQSLLRILNDHRISLGQIAVDEILDLVYTINYYIQFR